MQSASLIYSKVSRLHLWSYILLSPVPHPRLSIRAVLLASLRCRPLFQPRRCWLTGRTSKTSATQHLWSRTGATLSAWYHAPTTQDLANTSTASTGATMSQCSTRSYYGRSSAAYCSSGALEDTLSHLDGQTQQPFERRANGQRYGRPDYTVSRDQSRLQPAIISFRRAW